MMPLFVLVTEYQCPLKQDFSTCCSICVLQVNFRAYPKEFKSIISTISIKCLKHYSSLNDISFNCMELECD